MRFGVLLVVAACGGDPFVVGGQSSGQRVDPAMGDAGPALAENDAGAGDSDGNTPASTAHAPVYDASWPDSVTPLRAPPKAWECFSNGSECVCRPASDYAEGSTVSGGESCPPDASTSCCYVTPAPDDACICDYYRSGQRPGICSPPSGTLVASCPPP